MDDNLPHPMAPPPSHASSAKKAKLADTATGKVDPFTLPTMNSTEHNAIESKLSRIDTGITQFSDQALEMETAQKTPAVSDQCLRSNDLQEQVMDHTASSISDVMTEISQESVMLIRTWTTPFTESESFEKFCPTRLDKVLRDAHDLEENLKQQKAMLKERLQKLSHTLQILN